MKKVLLLTTLMMALAGCPGGGNSGRSTPIYPGGRCVNCGGFSQAAIGQSVTSTLPQAALTLNLVGNSHGMTMAAQFSNPLFSYQGQLMAQGSLYVATELFLGSCRLPVGNYTVQTLQVGVYDRGVFQIPAVQLTGPVTAVVALTEGVILTNGNGMITGFGAMMFGLNGPSAWNTGYQPYPGMGGQTNCGDMVGVRF